MSDLQPIAVAAIRGVGGAVIAAGSAFFTALQISGVSVAEAGVAAGAAGFTFLALRFGIEGAFDQRRAG